MYETIKEMLANATTDEGMEALLSFPIRVDVREEWHSRYDDMPEPCEYRILLPTMRYRVIGDLYNGEVISASLQKYDSWDGWHDLKIIVDSDIVLKYAKTVMEHN